MTRARIIIPTTDPDEPLTVESIPDSYQVDIEREGSLNEARNRGVRNAPDGFVIIMDDDLEFPPDLLEQIVERLDYGTLVGIADWDFGLIAGRIMAFHRDLWLGVRGFDERLGSHMGDTEFAISAWRMGYDIERIPREVPYHEPHDRTITTWDRLWRLAYLSLKHPTASPRLATGVLG